MTPPAAPKGQAPLRICLIQHSTRSDNLGVGALTAAEVAILRDAAAALGRELRITIYDWKDARPSYVTGPEIRTFDLDRRAMLHPGAYLATARASDLVIDIGAGDSFADIYGTSRLKRMFWLKFLTHLSGTPLVLAPQTIGPFTRTGSRVLARATLALSKLVATRDEKSTAALRELGYKGAIVEASDVALRLPYDPPPPRDPAAPLRVGINVSGLLMAGGYTGRNELGISLDYPGLIRDLIRHFQPMAEVHLVPHVIVPSGAMVKEDDRRPSLQLAEEFPGLVLAPAFASPSAAKSYIAGLDFFMGARMHACIAAFSSGVPVVPMAYSRKFEGLFGSLGYRRTVDCTRAPAAEIFAAITQGFTERETLRAEMGLALAEGRRRLARYETALQDLLRGLG